ncbi:MAG: hypothetical protein WDZ64_00790 [Parcubacteria group bacterium]
MSTHKVNAQFVVSDPAHTAITGAEAARKIGKDALDFGARIAAQIAIQQIINSTVAWASSGFEGNPAYVTDPSQFFGDIADGVAGEYIMGGDLGFLCSPFQANIRVSLAQQYYQPRQFQCTLTGIVGNIEDFYSDFSSGGWDAWFSMTQTPINNPYGAFLETKIELDSRVESALSLEQDQLNWNQGFRSWSACIATNPEPWIDSPSVDGSLPSRIPNPRHEPNRAVGECIERGPTQTPGSIIKSQLDTVLPAGLDRLINVQQVDQLIDAFAAGILRRYVFGSDGLFSRNGEQVPDLGEVTPLPGSGEIPEIPTIPPGGEFPPTSGAPNERDRVNTIASDSPEWGDCASGSGVACHRFVREVASILANDDPRWGLLTKQSGQQSCTMTECGPNVGGYGEDVIVYLLGTEPSGPITIVDIIGGAGAPGANITWQIQPRRAGNDWAPVP